MNDEKFTIADVAEKTGVSRSTISRVLNERPGVGPALRQKVLDYIKEIDYKPNTLAQGLIKGRINIIALIFGDVRNPFYADLMFHMQKILNENGYMVMAFNSEYELEKEIDFVNTSSRFNFSGLILVTAQSKELAKRLQTVNMPILLVNRTLEACPGDKISIDNFQAGYIATKHLVDLGHPQVAFISGHMTSSSISQRYEGLRQVLKNYQIPFDESKHLFIGDLRMDTGYRLAKQYVANLAEMPSAIVISNDMMAIGFMDYCRSKGVKVPEMLSITGFDNIPFSGLRGIGLTTVDQQAERMSIDAARLILRRINDPEVAPERIVLEPELIIRTTTAPYDPHRLDHWPVQIVSETD